MGEGDGYRPPKVPRCSVCGSRLEVSATGPGGITFACPEPEYIGGTEEEKKHYSKSRMQFPSGKKAEIYALCREVRRLADRPSEGSEQ